MEHILAFYASLKIGFQHDFDYLGVMLPWFLLKGSIVWCMFTYIIMYIFYSRFCIEEIWTYQPNLMLFFFSRQDRAQLDCPNSTQSLSNVVNQTFYTQEIQKTHQISHFQEKTRDTSWQQRENEPEEIETSKSIEACWRNFQIFSEISEKSTYSPTINSFLVFLKRKQMSSG